MSELTDTQIATLISLLDAREQMLKAFVQEHSGLLRSIGAADIRFAPGDVADQADVEIERRKESASVEHSQRELDDINAARARIAEGEEGVCIDCGETIQFERLLAQPTARRCIECQEFHENPLVHTPYVYGGAAESNG